MPFTDLDKPRNKRFIAAVERMERVTRRVEAYVIIDPTRPDARRGSAGRIVVTHPSDGAMTLRAVAWMPAPPESAGSYDWMDFRHAGSANGYGYDKASAAMSGALFWSIRDQKLARLNDDGYRFYDQLRDHGYIVVQAV